MTVSFLRAYARLILVASLALFACTRGHAAGNWEAGKIAFGTYCTGCHVVTSDPPNNSVGRDPTSLQAKINSTSGSMRAAVAPILNPLRTSGATNDTVSDLAAYIAKPNFPVIAVSTTVLDLGTRVANLTTNTLSVRVTNNGDLDLNLTAAAVTDTDNFSVTPTSCTIPPTGTNYCDLFVTFKPQLALDPITATLNLTHDAFYKPTVSLTGIGVLPLVLVGPATVQFNSGDAAKPLRVVDNIGNQVRVCKSGGASFPSPSDFTVGGISLDGTTGCATLGSTGTLPRNIDLTVTFLAAAGSGPKNAVLTYQRVSGVVELGTPVTVQLQGNLGPVISFDDTNPFSHGANDQTEVDGSAFVDRVINISNTGNGPLNFTSFVITSADPAKPEIASEYALAGTGCQAVATLAPGAPPCALTLRFDPAALGLRAASLTITSDGKNLPQPQVIPLNGVGKHGPRLGVAEGSLVLASDASINFTSQRLGQTYPARTLTLSNGGTLGDLELSMPASNAVPGFTIVPGAGCSTLQPAASCTLAITFAPSQLQHYAGVVEIGSRPAGGGGAFNVFRLNLLGDGTDQAPALSWRDPTQLTTVVSALAFDEVQAGNSQERRVVVWNDGPGSVVLQVLNVVGVDAPNFSVDAGTCKLGQFLGEHSSCEVILRFAPVTAGAKTASLQVISNGNGPFALPATGTGRAGATASVLALSPSALSFATTVVGAQSEPLDMTLTNSGTQALTVQSLAVTGPYVLQNKTCQATPFVLLPAAQCTLTVSFKPSAQGSGAGVLQVTTDASSTPTALALSGEGRAPADVSGGGCTVIGGDPRTDPTLWLLVLLAAVVLWRRRQAHPIRGGAASPSSQRRNELEQ